MPKPAGYRPVVLLSRDAAYEIRDFVTVAKVTTRIRNIPVEVPLGKDDGLSKPCVVNLDAISTISKRNLKHRIALLKPEKIIQINHTLRFALGL